MYIVLGFKQLDNVKILLNIIRTHNEFRIIRDPSHLRRLSFVPNIHSIINIDISILSNRVFQVAYKLNLIIYLVLDRLVWLSSHLLWLLCQLMWCVLSMMPGVTTAQDYSTGMSADVASACDNAWCENYSRLLNWFVSWRGVCLP